MKNYNKYIMNIYFTTPDGVSYDTIPVVCESKDHINNLIASNMQTYTGVFTLFNYDFDTRDIIKHGYDIKTVDEFFEAAQV